MARNMMFRPSSLPRCGCFILIVRRKQIEVPSLPTRTGRFWILLRSVVITALLLLPHWKKAAAYIPWAPHQLHDFYPPMSWGEKKGYRERQKCAFSHLSHRKCRTETSSLHHSQRDGLGVGIDLGTTFSAVAYLNQEGIPAIISIPGNGRTMPSVVSFSVEPDGQHIWVGKAACDREKTWGAYRNVKRVLGTGGRVSADVAQVVPFVIQSLAGKTYKKDSLLNQLHDATEHPTLLKASWDEKATIRPEEISSQILKTLIAAAEESTGRIVNRAVIGVPAYFNDAQREATKRAAEMGGISKVKLLREPEAAALAYGIGKEQIGMGEEEELVLVFDLGGGTYDVSMLLVGGGLTEILCTSGNVRLGGSDFDARIAKHLQGLLRDRGVALHEWSKESVNAILLAAEQIRIYLSNNRKANLALPVHQEKWLQMSDFRREVILPLNIAESLPDDGMSNSTHILCQLSRNNMERLCRDEFLALLPPLRQTAIMSGAMLPGDSSPSMVDAALEIDWQEDNPNIPSSSLPFEDFYSGDNDYEEQLSTPLSSKEPNTISRLDSDLMLLALQEEMNSAKKAQQQGRKKARNVAKQERKFREEKRKLEESGPAKRRLEAWQGDGKVKIRDGITGRPIARVVLVGGATRMPAIGRLLEALTGVVPQRTVNPDEAVALGCAVHVGILDGRKGMGTVLNPMQAAILRAVAAQQGPSGLVVPGDKDQLDDDDEFDAGEKVLYRV